MDNRDRVYRENCSFPRHLELKVSRFLMHEGLYKGHLTWLLLIYFLQFDVHSSFFLEVYGSDCICLMIYFVGIQI